jgi:hypothetical protein
VWVKSWAELIRDAEGRLDFVQKKLRIQVSADEIEKRISQLKLSFLKSEAVAHPSSTDAVIDAVAAMAAS